MPLNLRKQRPPLVISNLDYTEINTFIAPQFYFEPRFDKESQSQTDEIGCVLNFKRESYEK